jgi:hypothetical protein
MTFNCEFNKNIIKEKVECLRCGEYNYLRYVEVDGEYTREYPHQENSTWVDKCYYCGSNLLEEE